MDWADAVDLAGYDWSPWWRRARTVALILACLFASHWVAKVALAYGEIKAHPIEVRLQQEFLQLERSLPTAVPTAIPRVVPPSSHASP